jgi:hypothetical protein
MGIELCSPRGNDHLSPSYWYVCTSGHVSDVHKTEDKRMPTEMKLWNTNKSAGSSHIIRHVCRLAQHCIKAFEAMAMTYRKLIRTSGSGINSKCSHHITLAEAAQGEMRFVSLIRSS